jgi:3-polyprenyl-4-hydroxybenzoate decarboxylase
MQWPPQQQPISSPLGGEDQGEGGRPMRIDATKKLPGEGFKRPWPALIKMDEALKAKVEKLFNP